MKMHNRLYRGILALLVVVSILIGGWATPANAQSGQFQVVKMVEIQANSLGMALSPDGKQIAILGSEGMCIWSTDGQKGACGVLSAVSSTLLPVFIDVSSMAFSPDGKYLTFTENYLGNLQEPDIYLMNTSTGAIRNLTPDSGVSGQVSGINPSSAIDLAPTFSLDSKSIYFVRYGFSGREASEPALRRVLVTGGASTRIAYLSDLEAAILAMRWMPDGKQLILTTFGRSATDTQGGIYTIGADGKGLKQIYQTFGYADVVPSSDGKRFVAYSAGNRLQNLNKWDEPTSFTHTAQGELEGPITPPSSGIAAHFAALMPYGTAIAYLVRDAKVKAENGLYIADAPGQLGRRIYGGELIPGSGQGTYFRPLAWAANGVLVVFDSARRQYIVLWVAYAL